MGDMDVIISVESPDSEDALHCIEAYFRELDARFEHGFDPGSGGYATGMDEGTFLIVRHKGRPVGCGAVRVLGDGIGEIKRMWLSPELRGYGIARKLLQALEDEARELGVSRVRLDTNRSLSEAFGLYRQAGYVEIERYNDNLYADYFFEKKLDV